MRGLLAFVLALGLAWGGYWFVGSRALERGAEAWFAQSAASGLIAEKDSLTVRGFPSRFDLTVEGLHLADPATGYGWSAPFVQVFSLTYKPWHVIAALPPEESFTTPFGTLTLTSGKLQGSVKVHPETALALDRITVVGDDLALASDQGWRTTARQVRFATRRLTDDGTRHQIGLDVIGVIPDAAWVNALPGLATSVEKLHIDADVAFTAPLDRHAGETRPQLAEVKLTELTLTWGELGLFGRGAVTADAEGRAEGRIEVTLSNWRKLMPIAVAAGFVAPDVAPTWERALAMLAAQSGNPEDLTLPLVLNKGRMSFGPLPLGPAPMLN